MKKARKKRAVRKPAGRLSVSSSPLKGELVRLASFVEHNPNPILEVQGWQFLTYLNRTGRELFPELPKQGVKHPLLAGLPAIIKELGLSHKRYLTSEIHVAGRDYELHVFTMPDLSLAHIYLTDITGRKHLDRMKDDFISAVSHELRTPLTIIKGAVANLKDGIAGPLSEPQMKIATIADNNVNRLSRIINDLLDLSRLESGQGHIDLRRLDLKIFLESWHKALLHEGRNKNIRVELVLPENLPPVYADSNMVLQVIDNLVNNGLRFAKSQILIRAQASFQEGPPGKEKIPVVLVIVGNDGPGIPRNRLHDLFNKFVQIERPLGGAGYKGTGLGLAICREIISAHRGKIWAEAGGGGGLNSEFHFTLPVYDDPCFADE